MPFNTVKQVINDDHVDLWSLQGKEYMMLKILSNDYKSIEEADMINKYLFSCNSNLVHGLLYLIIKNNLKYLPKFVRKTKSKPDNIDNILREYFECCRGSFLGSESEFFEYRDILRHHLNDKNNLREVLTAIRADEKMFKKFKVPYKVPDAKLVKAAEQPRVKKSETFAWF